MISNALRSRHCSSCYFSSYLFNPLLISVSKSLPSLETMISRLLSLGAAPALRTTLTHQGHTSLATRLVIQNPTWSRSISMTRPVFAEKAKKSAAKATKETKSKAKTTAAEDEAATKKSRPRVRKSVGRPESKAASKEKEGLSSYHCSCCIP